MLFSIVIRTKNEEAWIKRCLKMIYAQDNQDFEIIIVDNQSDDKTLEIVGGFRSVKVLKIDEFFPGQALNMGISAASGTYIVALSAHCIPVSSKWLDELRDAIENTNDPKVVAAYGRQIPISSTGLTDKRDLLNTFGLDPIIQTKDFFFHNANSIVRREFLLEHPYSNDITNVEDRVWAKEVIESGWHISYTPLAEVYHHHGLNHGNSDQRLRKVTSLIEPLYKEYQIEKYDALRLKSVKAICMILSKDSITDLKSCIEDARCSVFVEKIIIVSLEKPMGLKENESWISRKMIKDVDSLQLLEILAQVCTLAAVDKTVYDYCVFVSPYYQNRPKELVDLLIQRAELKYFDVCFAGKRVYPNLWQQELGGNYKLVDPNTALRDYRTPLIEAFFGLSLVLSMHMLNKKNLSDGYIGIIELEDYAEFGTVFKDRYF
jgi:rhamnosyltransferase